MKYLPVVVATLTAFVFSAVWYTVFAKTRMLLLGNDLSASADMMTVPVSQKLFELARSLIVVIVVAHLLEIAQVSGWLGSVRLGVWLCIFPVMILLGAALWDKRPWMLVAIHGGDWIIKIILVAVILGVWRQKSG
jgi:hypothetical protein